MGAVALSLPAAHVDAGRGISFFDAFFTAISAFTNTGLTVKSTAETFSLFGQMVILLLIQAGGMGFLTILIFLWVLLRRRRRVTIEHRLFLHWERGSHNKVESLDAVKIGIIVLLVAELVGAYLLTIFFYSVEPTRPTATSDPSGQDTVGTKGRFWRSMWHGIFHSVSAANNAGFDILGRHSIIPYRNGHKNFLSAVLLVESILGGIGYPIFHEVWNYFRTRRNTVPSRFSISFTMSIMSYFVMALLGALAAVCFEVAGSGHGQGIFVTSQTTPPSFGWSPATETADKVWSIVYLSFSSRSSGFTPVLSSDLTEATRCLLSVLMFIGANPASTGGGIRTVTMFVILAHFLYTARGRRHLTIFRKTISPSIVHDSLQIFILSIILLVFAVFILVLSSRSHDRTIGVSDAFFEATSAFGTAGLTSGVTERTNAVGRTMLIFLMFVGQLGVSNALVSITDLQSKSKDFECVSANVRIM